MRVMMKCSRRLTISALREVFKRGQHISALEWHSARCYRSWLQSIGNPSPPNLHLPSGPHHWESNSGSESGAIWSTEESHLHQGAGRDSESGCCSALHLTRNKTVVWNVYLKGIKKKNKLKWDLDECNKASQGFSDSRMNSNCKSKPIYYLELNTLN